MKPLYTAVALAISAALTAPSAYAQATSDGPGTRTTPPVQPGAQPERPAAAGTEQRSSLEREDRSFLEDAIQGSYAEIEGSRLALEKTESPEVREFAQMMIDDHQKIVDEATALATAKGLTPPDGPSVMQKTEITALRALSGGPFDSMYVNRIGVAAHESSVELFEQASQEAQDPEVKALVDKTLPKLREHLGAAQALNEKQDRE